MPNPRLPSISELLESPPLKGLVETVNPSTILARSRTFLDTVRREAERTTANWQVPSTKELAERIAGWIQLTQDTLPPVAINATGTLFTQGCSPPLGSEATAAVCHYLGEFVLAESPDHAGRLVRLLQPLVGSVSAQVYGSHAAALHLALSALGGAAGSGKMLVRRCDVVASTDGGNILELCKSTGVSCAEVGLANATSIEDFKAALPEANLFWLDSATLATAGETELKLIQEMVAAAHSHDVKVIADARCASLVDMQPYGLKLLTLRQLADLGVDVLVTDSAGLIGGPDCGLVLGKGEALEQIAKLPLAKLMPANRAVHEALLETLRLYADTSQAEIKIPILTLLSTPSENLRLRAERLASQIAQADDVQSAQPVEVAGRLWEQVCPQATLPGWGVQLKTSASFASRISKLHHPAVLLAEGDGGPLLNLRSVLTRHDLTLAGVVGRQAPEVAE